ncbi:MAG: YggT family protein [Treponema sp.]|nr:YggT family protein [Candidatus Treponema equifaecale]
MQIFRIISALISLYTLLCFVRIMLTWFPGAEYSKFGRVLSQACDPYLNLFKRFSFLRFSAFDFTPAIAICILIAASTICTGLSSGAKITLGSLLAMLLSMAWSIVSSILMFLTIILVVRLIVYLIKGDTSTSYSIWTSVDRALTPIIFRISGLFTGGRPVSFKTSLGISILTLIVFNFVGKFLIGFICALLVSLPF